MAWSLVVGAIAVIFAVYAGLHGWGGRGGLSSCSFLPPGGLHVCMSNGW